MSRGGLGIFSFSPSQQVYIFKYKSVINLFSFLKKKRGAIHLKSIQETQTSQGKLVAHVYINHKTIHLQSPREIQVWVSTSKQI